MGLSDVDYHLTRAARERDLAANAPADIGFFHSKLANLHEQRAKDLASGQLTSDDQLYFAR